MQRRNLRKASPTLQGVSVVAYCIDKRNQCQEKDDIRGCLLLLGNVTNALAAASVQDEQLHQTSLESGYKIRISHIVSVADNGKAAQVNKTIQQQSSSSVQFSSYYMADRLRPDETICLREVAAKPLMAIEQAMGCSASDLHVKPPTILADATKDTTIHRAILVHCNEGYNRSPTLVLAFLMNTGGLTLRDAYKLVLQSRPGIDSLPPYRRALREHEQFITNKSTVNESETFQLHLSELLQFVDQESQNNGTTADPAEYRINRVHAARELRRKAIADLLSEASEG